jgi:DnaJ like chaperone protein
MKSKRILHSITGYLFGGPLGGLFGYFSDDLVEKAKQKLSEEREDSGVNLLLLGAAIAKADGKEDERKTDFIRYYFTVVFGEEKARIKLRFLTKVMSEKYDPALIARDASSEYEYGTKLQILNYLFRIAAAGGPISQTTIRLISILANNLEIEATDYLKIKKRYLRNTPGLACYEVLGCKPDQSMAEITAIYRKLVLKYHPDRINTKDEREIRLAGAKFQEIKRAYQEIKSIKSN